MVQSDVLQVAGFYALIKYLKNYIICNALVMYSKILQMFSLPLTVTLWYNFWNYFMFEIKKSLVENRVLIIKDNKAT